MYYIILFYNNKIDDQRAWNQRTQYSILQTVNKENKTCVYDDYFGYHYYGSYSYANTYFTIYTFQQK